MRQSVVYFRFHAIKPSASSGPAQTAVRVHLSTETTQMDRIFAQTQQTRDADPTHGAQTDGFRFHLSSQHVHAHTGADTITDTITDTSDENGVFSLARSRTTMEKTEQTHTPTIHEDKTEKTKQKRKKRKNKQKAKQPQQQTEIQTQTQTQPTTQQTQQQQAQTDKDKDKDRETQTDQQIDRQPDKHTRAQTQQNSVLFHEN